MMNYSHKIFFFTIQGLFCLPTIVDHSIQTLKSKGFAQIGLSNERVLCYNDRSIYNSV
jgi:hypothetical protein